MTHNKNDDIITNDDINKNVNNNNNAHNNNNNNNNNNMNEESEEINDLSSPNMDEYSEQQYQQYYAFYYEQYYNNYMITHNLEKNIQYLSANLIKLSDISYEKIDTLEKSNKYLNTENNDLRYIMSDLENKIDDLAHENKRNREKDIDGELIDNKKLKLIIKRSSESDDSSQPSLFTSHLVPESQLKYDYKKNKYSYSATKILQTKSEIKSIVDIIKLKDKFKEIRHDDDLIRLYHCIDSLDKLNKMIGMDTIKDEVFKHLIYYIKNKENEHMLHTVITGSPGTGKTELGSILANIYLAVGALKKNTFKIVKRSDLIAGYLGQTAIKTQKVINECDGGVLFIDEAYSLGNNEQRDSFSKECLDTLNLNLTEKKNTFMCIIAGYPDDLNKCFFAYNAGLERRFSFKYDIEKYTPTELMEIFLKKVNENKLVMSIDKKNLLKMFEQHYEQFKFFGGDVEKFLFYVKLESSKRCFQQNIKMEIIKEDMEKSIDKLKNKTDDTTKTYTNMYL